MKQKKPIHNYGEITNHKPELNQLKTKGIELAWAHSEKKMTTALPDKHYSGHCNATEKEKDQKTSREQIWRNIRGQQVSYKMTDGARRRRQHRTELDEVKRFTPPPRATRHKSSQVDELLLGWHDC